MAAFSDLMMRLLFQDKASPGLKQAQRNVNSFGQAVGSVNKVLGVFGVTLGGAAIVSGLANLTRLGAQAETVGASFDNLARSTGLASDAMLGSLRQASRGAISDMELMQAANKAMIMGGQEMGRALPQLLELARAAALATGEDMQFMFNSIVTGIARQSPLILDNLGLIVDMPSAYKAYADSIGVSVTALTEQQKMTALLNDVLRITPDYLNKVGGEATTSAEKLDAVRSAWGNLKQAVGEGLVVSIITSVEGAGADPAGFIEQVAKQISELNQLKADTRSLIKRLPLDQQVAASEEYSRIVKGLDGVGNVDAALRGLNNQLRAQIGLLPLASVLTEAYALSTLRLTGMLRAASASVPNVMAGLSYGNKLPEYITRTAKMGENYYNYHHGETAGESYGSGFVSGFDSQINAIQSKIQSALGSRMTPTATDFMKTQLGTYENAPLESVRQLDAIIARGFSEIKAHPDWAAILKIPDDVLQGSELGLKAWAADTRDAAAALARPDLVDWDAFLKEFDRLSAIESGQQAVYQQAWDYLKSSGKLGNQAQSEGILRSMFGLDSPEAQGKALGQALTTAFGASDPAGIFLNTFKTGTDQRKTEFENAGKALGKLVGKPVGEKILDEIATSMTGGQFTVTVAVNRAGANSTGGGYQALQ